MLRRGWVVGVVVAISSEDAVATPCDCDHVIEPDVGIANGGDLGVSPGQTVCVRGGPREFLRLQNFTGAPDQAIVIRNCEGVVDISNDDRGYALTVDASRYVQVTGTGDENSDYGFRARAARTAPDYSGMSVAVGDLSSDIELDHVEAYEAGFAGIMWQTNPRCDLSANLGTFVMENSRIHHNLVHDTGGEGLYFGSTGYGGREYTCDGQQVLLYPHELHGADIHDNIFRDTGWDGAQIGVTPEDCAFHHNTIQNVGLAGELYQQQGLQIGGASTCDIFNNRLADGPANGIFVFGADDTLVHDNLVINFGESGIYANDQDQDLAARYRFAFNTVIVGDGMRGITVFGAKLGPGWAFDNVAVGPNALGVGNEVPDFIQMANHTAETPDGVGFIDPAARDYRLQENSILRDAGALPPEFTLGDDLDGNPRSDGAPDIGAFEWTPEPPPGDDTTGAPDTTTTDSNATTTTTDNDTLTPTSDAAPTSEADASTHFPGDSESDTDPPTSSTTTSTTGAQDDPDDGCGCATTTAPPTLALLLLLARRRPTRAAGTTAARAAR